MSVYLYTGPRHITDYQSLSCLSRISILIPMSLLVCSLSSQYWNVFLIALQDGSGWTPLMIAASLKNAEGDAIIDLLLRKDADVNIKSVSGQVRIIRLLLVKYFLKFISIAECSPLCSVQSQSLHRQNPRRPQMQRASQRQTGSTRFTPGCRCWLDSYFKDITR